jgi:RNA polymerase sigma-70 factor (TIGR02943 family)
MSHMTVIAVNKVKFSHALCIGAIKSQLNISPNVDKENTKPAFPLTPKHPVLKLIIGGRAENKPLNELANGLHLFNDHLAELQPMLIKVAKLRLRNDAWAEDAVSETIIAALEKPNAFAGRSMLRTWLIGILKHKLVDQIRKHTRECQAAQFDEESDADFNTTTENINEEHVGWGDPEKSLIQQQFIAKLDTCLKKLPKQQAQVFKLRYGMEMEPSEICHQLGLTHSNLHVMLHRSRKHVRASLI